MPAASWLTTARAGLVALHLSLLPAGACTSWHTETAAAPDAIARQQPSTARVTLFNGATVVVHEPRIVGDSLAGWSGDRTHEVHIPLSDIRSTAIRKVSAAKTALLLAGVGVTVAAVAAASSDWGTSPGGGSGGGTGSGNGTYSCPLVYSWDGHGWRLDSGTFGGAITRGLARTDVDNLVFAAAPQGVLRLKLANELAETDYVDELTVLAVDAPHGTAVAPDAEGGLHTIGTLTAPLAARDFAGRDALARVRSADGWHWESSPAGRDPSRAADRRDGLEVRFGRPTGSMTARLVLDANNTPWAASLMGRFVAAHGGGTQAWYDSLDRNPPMARELGARIARQAFLSVAVRTRAGWVPQGLAWEAGPEVSKQQVIPLDLRAVDGDTVVVRLESVPSFWLIDRVAIDFGKDYPVQVHHIQAHTAVDNHGNERRANLALSDGVVDTLATGESVLVSFQAPAVPAGARRTYLVRSTGWYRITSPERGPSDTALLSSVLAEPDGLSRVATMRLQEAVALLNRVGQ